MNARRIGPIRGSTAQRSASDYSFDCDALGGEGFNDIRRLDIGEISNGDPALESSLNLAGRVLEALQGLDFSSKHHHVVAKYAHFAVALDLAIDHHAACHISNLADAEYFAHLGAALVDLFEDGLEHAGHGALQFVRQLVDDGVQADVHLFLFSESSCVSFRSHVEADDDGVGCGSQQNVTFVDRSQGGAQHTDSDALIGKFLNHVCQHLGGAAHIGLHNDVEFLDFAFLQLLVQLLQRYSAGLGHGHIAGLGFAIDDDLLGLAGIGDKLERIADFGQGIEAQDFSGHRRNSGAQGLDAIVEHGADLADNRSADEIIADVQRAVAHDHRGHRASAAIKLCFENRADGGPVRIGLEIQHFRD